MTVILVVSMVYDDVGANGDGEGYDDDDGGRGDDDKDDDDGVGSDEDMLAIKTLMMVICDYDAIPCRRLLSMHQERLVFFFAHSPFFAALLGPFHRLSLLS